MPDPISWAHALPYYSLSLLFGYLLGSIPFGLVLTRFAGMGDVRNIGSGNIGATNVLRTGNKKIAAATLLGDMFKGTVAVWIASRFGPDCAVIAALGAFLGHCFPVWLKFKGGKGVATYVGLLLGFSWLFAAVFGIIWLTCAAVTRYSSLSALVASLGSVIFLHYENHVQLMELFALLTALLWLFHRENIMRLLRGEEGKIGAKG